MKSATILPLLFLCSNLLFSQGDNHYPNKWKTFSSKAFYQENIVRDSLVNWQEEVLLHLSDTQPEEKQTLFFKSYVRIGKNKVRSNASKVLIVDLVNNTNELFKRQFHEISDGMSVGKLKLPKNAKKGMYYVKAYTRWMQNYGEHMYAKEQINIGGVNNGAVFLNEKGVVIHSEGGNLVSGLKNHLFFKGIFEKNESGHIGYISDQAGQVVSEIKMFNENIASTILQPEKGKTYFAHLNNGQQHAIPKPTDEGLLLHVNNLDPKLAKVEVIASAAYLGKTIKLKGLQNGIVYFEQTLDFKQNPIINITIQKKDIPSGKLILGLYDETDQQVATRAIWIEGRQLHITVDQINEESKNKVLHIQVRDDENKPVRAELAVGILNWMEGIGEDYEKDDILVSSGNESFQEKRNQRYVKDINLILSESTIAEEATEETIPSIIQFPMQKGLELYGYAYDLDNNLLKNTTIQILASSEGAPWIEELETNASGQLRIENLQFYGKTEMVFRTKGKDTKSRLVKIIPTIGERQGYSKELTKFQQKQEKKRFFEATGWQPVDTTNLIELDEVQVNQKRAESEKNNTLYGVEPTATVFQNPKHPIDLVELVRKIPGMLVTGTGSDVRVQHSRAFTSFQPIGPPLWIVDGMPWGKGFSSFNSPIGLISALDIEKVELVFGPEAAIFGSRATGGVILIYTRSGSGSNFVPRKEGQLIFQGYEPNIGFDDYKTQENRKKYKRESDVVYWNPKLQTNNNGEVMVKLEEDYLFENFRIKATTVSRDGTISATDVILKN
ncbi:TonB-dependent receptor [Flagellimonas sp. 2504JD1-5]